MRISAFLAAAALAGAIALPAVAQGPNLYPYPSPVNYCPAGLQPVVLGGVICCGQPTTSMTWAEVMRHPVQRAGYVRAYSCPEGVKGCN